MYFWVYKCRGKAKKKKKKQKSGGKKIEKPHFFLPGLHLGIQTTLPVEKPA